MFVLHKNPVAKQSLLKDPVYAPHIVIEKTGKERLLRRPYRSNTDMFPTTKAKGYTNTIGRTEGHFSLRLNETSLNPPAFLWCLNEEVDYVKRSGF